MTPRVHFRKPEKWFYLFPLILKLFSPSKSPILYSYRTPRSSSFPPFTETNYRPILFPEAFYFAFLTRLGRPTPNGNKEASKSWFTYDALRDPKSSKEVNTLSRNLIFSRSFKTSSVTKKAIILK